MRQGGGAVAIKQTITVFYGEDIAVDDTIYDVNGCTEDISGWAIAFAVTETDDPSDGVLISKTTASGGVTLSNPTVGILTITLDSDDTSLLDPGRYFFTVARTDNGAYTVLTYGPYVVKGNAVLP